MTSRRDLSTWSGIIPRAFRERVAFIGLILGSLFGIVFEFLIVYPIYYEYFTPFFYWNIAFVAFLLFNIFGNLYKLITVDASGRNSDLPSILKPQWKYCYVCHLNAPPRSYHCTQCDECILKRDHHCLFGGCCVGYHNHRYYLFCLVYVCIACQYMTWWHWSYIWDALGGYSIGTFLCLIFPQFAVILRLITFTQFLLSCTLMSSLFVQIAAMNMLISQILLILRGQSQHEYLQNIRIYDLGVALNLQDVLGTRWMIGWICPFFSSPLLGDGLRFPDRKEFENVKDM